MGPGKHTHTCTQESREQTRQKETTRVIVGPSGLGFSADGIKSSLIQVIPILIFPQMCMRLLRELGTRRHADMTVQKTDVTTLFGDDLP